MSPTFPLDSQLEQFKLSLKHGDRTENDLWPLVRHEFANYEIFWRRFIIPCTNRVVPDSPGPNKIRLRKEAKQFEEMVISHYSTFFYFAHGTKFLSARNPDLLANIVFFLLHTSIENLEIFLDRAAQAHYESTGRRVSFGQPKNENDAVKDITAYRNILAHKPIVGRAIDYGVEKLPAIDALKRVHMSWLEAENLKDADFVDAQQLLEELRSGYGKYLNDKWGEVINAMEKARPRLIDRLQVPVTDIIIPTTSQPIGASGQIMRSDIVAVVDYTNRHARPLGKDKKE